MKKWKFLVATTLVCGALTTVTSCIDNDEPAGISDLRGAKAELIKAQAALKLVEVEYQKVNVEIQNIKLEKEKVELQVAQYEAEVTAAKTDYEKELWAQRKDSVINDFQGEIFKLKQTAAENEANYLKALATLEAVKATANDEAFARELGELIGQLTTARGDVNNTQNEIIRLSNTLVKFSSNRVDVLKDNVSMDLKLTESKIANSQVILEQIEALKESSNIDDLKAQRVQNQQKQKEVTDKVANLISELANTDAKNAPFEQAISKQKTLLEAPNQSIALEIPASIQNSFITTNLLNSPAFTAVGTWNSTSAQKTVNGMTVSYFTQNPTVTNIALGEVAPSSYDIDILKLLSHKLLAIKKEVEKGGNDAYRTAYTRLRSAYSLPALTSSTGEELTATDLKLGEAALKKISADIELATAAYNDDLKAFKDAVVAYEKAKADYGWGGQYATSLYNPVNNAYTPYRNAWTNYSNALSRASVTVSGVTYASITAAETQLTAENKKLANLKKDPNATNKNIADQQKIVDAFTKAINDAKEQLVDVTTALDNAQKTLTDALAAYYPARKALTGEVFKTTVAGVNEGKEFVIADKLASLTREQIAAVSANSMTLYGQEVNPNNVYPEKPASGEEFGALQKWLVASYELYGTPRSIATAKTVEMPLDEVYVNLNSDATIYPTNGSAYNYVLLTDAKDRFSSIDGWKALATTIQTLADDFAKKEDPIVAEVEKQVAGLKALLEPLRDKIYEICLLDATKISDATVSGIAGKLNIDLTAMNSTGELQTLQALETQLTTAITGNTTLNIDYITYVLAGNSLNPTSQSTVNTNNLNQVIEEIQKSIAACNEYAAMKKDVLKEIESGNLSSTNMATMVQSTKEEYENTLANLQERLKDQQAVLDALTQQKDDLIAALGTNN